MSDPEEQAFKRDHRFIVRLVLLLLVGVLIGAFVFAKITGPEVGTCASRGFGTVTTLDGGPPRPSE